MNYVMKEYTNLSYMSRRAGVFLQRLNKIYIDNTPGTHSDTCHVKTVPIILNGLGVKHVHFPLLPSVLNSLVQSDTKLLLISAMCHMGKKLALNLSFTNLTRLNRCLYLYLRGIFQPFPVTQEVQNSVHRWQHYTDKASLTFPNTPHVTRCAGKRYGSMYSESNM